MLWFVNMGLTWFGGPCEMIARRLIAWRWMGLSSLPIIRQAASTRDRRIPGAAANPDQLEAESHDS
jgi:hypothetical protein